MDLLCLVITLLYIPEILCLTAKIPTNEKLVWSNTPIKHVGLDKITDNIVNHETPKANALQKTGIKSSKLHDVKLSEFFGGDMTKEKKSLIDKMIMFNMGGSGMDTVGTVEKTEINPQPAIGHEKLQEQTTETLQKNIELGTEIIADILDKEKGSFKDTMAYIDSIPHNFEQFLLDPNAGHSSPDPMDPSFIPYDHEANMLLTEATQTRGEVATNDPVRNIHQTIGNQIYMETTSQSSVIQTSTPYIPQVNQSQSEVQPSIQEGNDKTNTNQQTEVNHFGFAISHPGTTDHLFANEISHPVNEGNVVPILETSANVHEHSVSEVGQNIPKVKQQTNSNAGDVNSINNGASQIMSVPSSRTDSKSKQGLTAHFSETSQQQNADLGTILSTNEGHTQILKTSVKAEKGLAATINPHQGHKQTNEQSVQSQVVHKHKEPVQKKPSTFEVLNVVSTTGNRKESGSIPTFKYPQGVPQKTSSGSQLSSSKQEQHLEPAATSQQIKHHTTLNVMNNFIDTKPLTNVQEGQTELLKNKQQQHTQKTESLANTQQRKMSLSETTAMPGHIHKIASANEAKTTLQKTNKSPSVSNTESGSNTQKDANTARFQLAFETETPSFSYKEQSVMQAEKKMQSSIHSEGGLDVHLHQNSIEKPRHSNVAGDNSANTISFQNTPSNILIVNEQSVVQKTLDPSLSKPWAKDPLVSTNQNIFSSVTHAKTSTQKHDLFTYGNTFEKTSTGHPSAGDTIEIKTPTKSNGKMISGSASSGVLKIINNGQINTGFANVGTTTDQGQGLYPGDSRTTAPLDGVVRTYTVSHTAIHDGSANNAMIQPVVPGSPTKQKAMSGINLSSQLEGNSGLSIDNAIVPTMKTAEYAMNKSTSVSKSTQNVKQSGSSITSNPAQQSIVEPINKQIVVSQPSHEVTKSPVIYHDVTKLGTKTKSSTYVETPSTQNSNSNSNSGNTSVASSGQAVQSRINITAGNLPATTDVKPVAPTEKKSIRTSMNKIISLPKGKRAKSLLVAVLKSLQQRGLKFKSIASLKKIVDAVKRLSIKLEKSRIDVKRRPYHRYSDDDDNTNSDDDDMSRGYPPIVL